MTDSTLDIPENFHFQGRICVSYQKRTAYSDGELPERPLKLSQVRWQSRYMTGFGKCQMCLGKDESVEKSGDRPVGEEQMQNESRKTFWPTF